MGVAGGGFARSCALIVLAAVVGCSPASAPDPAPLVPKVLVVGIDGMRPDAMVQAATPAIDALVDDGVLSVTAQTQQAAGTVSGPGWVSVLTGVDADKHDVWGNEGFGDRDPAWPTLFGRAHDAGLSSATAIHWIPIQGSIIEPGTVGHIELADDDGVATAMAEILDEEDHDLHFVHLDDVDHAGHDSGFSAQNPAYVTAIEDQDRRIEQLVDALQGRPTWIDEDWLVVVVTDHGGDATGHGAQNPECRTIPLLLSGPAAPAALDGATHMDVHPTVLAHLGLDPEPAWDLDGVVRLSGR